MTINIKTVSAAKKFSETAGGCAMKGLSRSHKVSRSLNPVVKSNTPTDVFKGPVTTVKNERPTNFFLDVLNKFFPSKH